MAEEEDNYVRIRVLRDGKTITSEKFGLDSTDPGIGLSVAKGLRSLIVQSALSAVSLPGLGHFLSVIGTLRHFLHTTKIEVFIETKIVGPAMGALVKTIVDDIYAEIKKRRARGKLKKVKVIIYGPDGKPIERDDK
jgi:hypothetical protein